MRRRWPDRRWVVDPEERDRDYHGRDESGRHYDGDTVRLPGFARWSDLLPARPADQQESDR